MQPRIYYHIYNHANGFENLFVEEENYRYFLSRYAYFINSVADTFAYCLMPNHIHFLVRIKTEAEIEAAFQNLQGFKNLGDLITFDQEIEKRVSQQFSNLFNSYSKSFNKRYSRRGSLFMQNFKRKEVDSENYFTRLIHYIHANPIHHSFVKEIADWRWSSYHSILLNDQTDLKSAEVIEWFGNVREFVNFHKQPVDDRTKLEMDL